MFQRVTTILVVFLLSLALADSQEYDAYLAEDEDYQQPNRYITRQRSSFVTSPCYRRAKDKITLLEEQVDLFKSMKIKLEMQVQQLNILLNQKGKCNDKGLKIEIANLKKRNKDLTDKVEFLNNRIFELQSNNKWEIELSSLRVELGRINQQNEDLKEFIQKLQTSDNSKCNQIVSELQSKLAIADLKITTLEGQNRKLQTINIELNAKFQALQNSNDLVADLRARLERSKDDKVQLQLMNSQLEALLESCRKDQIKIDEYIIQLQQLTIKNVNLEQDLAQCLSGNQTGDQLNALKEQNTLLLTLVTELNNQLKKAQLDSTENARLLAQIQILNQKNRDLETDKLNLKNTIDSINHQMEDQRNSYNTQISALTMEHQKCQNENSRLNKLIDNLNKNNSDFASIQKELNDLREINSEIQKANSELSIQVQNLLGFKNKNKTCQKNLKQQKEQNNELQAKLEILGLEINELKIQLSAMSGLKNQLSFCQTRLSEFQKQSGVNANLSMELATLKVQLTNQTAEIDRLKAQLVGALEQNKNCESSKNNLMDQLADLNKKLAGLNEEKNLLLIEMSTLKTQLSGSTSSGEGLLQENEQLKKRINSLLQQNNNLAGKLGALQAQLSSMTSSNQALQTQIDSLLKQINELSNDNSGMKILISQFESGQGQFQNTEAGLRAQILELKNQISDLMKKNNLLNSENQGLRSKTASLDAQIEQFKSQISTLNLTIIALREQGQGSNKLTILLNQCQRDLTGLRGKLQQQTILNSTLKIQIEELKSQTIDCSKIKTERDTFARQLLYVQNRLKNFRVSLVTNKPSEENKIGQTTTTTTSQTISSNNENNTSTCQNQLLALQQANNLLRERCSDQNKEDY